MLINIEIPMPPSVNKAYWNNPRGGRGRILTKTARQFKEGVTELVHCYLAEHDLVAEKSEYGLYIIMYTSRHNRDVSNIIKLTEDAVFDGFGLNDSCNLLVIAEKVPDKFNQCIVYAGHRQRVLEVFIKRSLQHFDKLPLALPQTQNLG